MECSQTISGILKTSTILISSDDTDGSYRSMRDVPPKLRKKLIECTSSSNAATILIADRAGREQISSAIRNLPGPERRKLENTALGSILSGDADEAGAPSPWRTSVAQAAGAAIAIAGSVMAWALFLHQW